jgi:hypothetical protein
VSAPRSGLVVGEAFTVREEGFGQLALWLLHWWVDEEAVAGSLGFEV